MAEEKKQKDQIKDLLLEGKSPSEINRALGLSSGHPTAYQIRKELGLTPDKKPKPEKTKPEPEQADNGDAIHYTVVLADLELRKEKIQNTIDTLKEIWGM